MRVCVPGLFLFQAGSGGAVHGRVWRGLVRQCNAWPGTPRIGEARLCNAWRGVASSGNATHGDVWRCLAWHAQAVHGMAVRRMA